MEASTIWAIGDLHSDVHCARSWVDRTGLISNLAHDARLWEWTDPSAHLIFMGDYIDKGPYALQVLQFVKQLTDRFPHHVTALMGNHEVHLLLDRSRPAGYRYLDYPYGVAHPMQYLDWLPSDKRASNSTRAVHAILDGLLTVYSRGMYRSISMTSAGPKSITRLVPDEEQQLVASELERWQTSYLDGVRTGSALGDWLHRLPVTARWADTLFVHGGVPYSLLDHLTPHGLEALNHPISQDGNPRLRSDEELEGPILELTEVRSPHPLPCVY